MKLKSKQTGEIMEFDAVLVAKDVKGNEVAHLEYDSIQKFIDQWEDYEEPKGYWYIDPMVCGAYFTKIKNDEDLYEFNKQIGNYFETKEEAEQAVEKLKAWKRLKDKGAEFYGWHRNQTGTYELYLRWEDRIPRSYEVKNDIDLLFGGEE